MLTAKLKVINVQKYLARENISIKKKIVKYNVNLFIRQCEFDIDILFDEKQISFQVKEMAGQHPEEQAPGDKSLKNDPKSLNIKVKTCKNIIGFIVNLTQIPIVQKAVIEGTEQTQVNEFYKLFQLYLFRKFCAVTKLELNDEFAVKCI